MRTPDLPAYFMGWSFVDYGWGVVPSESVVTLDGKEIPFEDWRVEYGMDPSASGRLVLLYHIAVTPKTPLSRGPHTFECQLYGLKAIYGDTDGDGVPDPVELKKRIGIRSSTTRTMTDSRTASIGTDQSGLRQ